MRLSLSRCLAIAQCLFGFAAQAEGFHLIICGSGGEPEFVERFADWGRRLQAALIDNGRNDPNRVLLLTEGEPIVGESTPIEPSAIWSSNRGRSDRDSIREAIRHLGAAMSDEDDAFVYLIGHGSHRRDEAKFIIPGPDLSAAELGALFGSLPGANRVVINATSSSAGFVNALGPANVIVCTATKSVDERNATEFMGQFIQAIEDGTADLDRDGRISVYEVCTQAAALTAAWYRDKGLIASEHALLEDNGDGLGTRLPVEVVAEGSAVDGERARTVFIKLHDFAADVPGALLREYEAAVQAVEDLKDAKKTLPEADYYEKLEALLVDAAKASRAIRDAAAAVEDSE